MVMTAQFIDSIEHLTAGSKAALKGHAQMDELEANLDAECDELFKEALQENLPAIYNALDRTAVKRILKHPGGMHHGFIPATSPSAGLLATRHFRTGPSGLGWYEIQSHFVPASSSGDRLADHCSESGAPAVRLAGKDHNLCFAEVQCELALFTEAGQCIRLSLESFWASEHQKEVLSIQRQWD
ncbi:TPA: hypothetical protein ACH3X2_005017 [Trebouxia sp. C0005]